MPDFGVAVVGAGVVGLAVAARLGRRPGDVVLLERNDRHGAETSSRNSEVIHAGMYYPTGSLKARLCVEGNRRLYEFCRAHDVPHRRIGKLIVAMSETEVPALRRAARAGPGQRRAAGGAERRGGAGAGAERAGRARAPLSRHGHRERARPHGRAAAAGARRGGGRALARGGGGPGARRRGLAADRARRRARGVVHRRARRERGRPGERHGGGALAASTWTPPATA